MEASRRALRAGGQRSRRGFGLAVFAVAFGLCNAAAATTFLMVSHTTGGDDLRGGNTAYITMILNDGTVVPERPLVSGARGLPGGTSVSNQGVRFTQNIDASQIRAFRIRHDGNPRSGHPFDTYDNWDLRSMRIVVRRPSGCTLGSDSAAATPVPALVHRFTGESRTVDLPRGPLRGVPC